MCYEGLTMQNHTTIYWFNYNKNIKVVQWRGGTEVQRKINKGVLICSEKFALILFSRESRKKWTIYPLNIVYL